MKLEMHKFALMFPVASHDDKRRLETDIRNHGIKVPVVLFQGKILDGRSRYLIGRKFGITIPTTDFLGTAANALALVASYNLCRRHLKQSQKAMIAADISRLLQEMDDVEPEEAKMLATKATGASNGYVEKAARIIEKHPEIAKQIRNGEETIGGVYGRSKTKCPNCGHTW